MARDRRNPILAALFSLVLPGAGQIWIGGYLVGVFFIVLAAAFWYSRQPTLAVSCHVLAAASAYWGAQRLNQTGAHRRRR